MPCAPARIRRQYVEGTTEVCPWDVEECLVYGVPLMFGPPGLWRTVDEWAREWARWRSVIEPKVRQYRPGRRAFAQYVLGEIAPREPLLPLPQPNEWWLVDVRGHDGKVVSHPVNVPEPWVRAEWKHLRGLGLLEPDELQRAREQLERKKPTTRLGRRAGEYVLEAALYE